MWIAEVKAMADMILAGFGGQGILTAGKILIDVAAQKDAPLIEIHHHPYRHPHINAHVLPCD